MAELGDRTAGFTQHVSFYKYSGTDASSEIDKSKVLFPNLCIYFFGVGIAGGVLQKSYRIFRESKAQIMDQIAASSGSERTASIMADTTTQMPRIRWGSYLDKMSL